MRLNGLVVSFLSINFLGTFARPSKRSLASEVEAFLTQLTTDANAAVNILQEYQTSGGTVTEALELHTSLGTLNSDLSSDITSFLAMPSSPLLSEADGTTVVNQANTGLTPAIVSILNGISTFSDSGLPVSGIAALIKQDGQTLEDNSSTFYNMLLAILPADIGTPLNFPGPILVQPGT